MNRTTTQDDNANPLPASTQMLDLTGPVDVLLLLNALANPAETLRAAASVGLTAADFADLAASTAWQCIVAAGTDGLDGLELRDRLNAAGLDAGHRDALLTRLSEWSPWAGGTKPLPLARELRRAALQRRLGCDRVTLADEAGRNGQHLREAIKLYQADQAALAALDSKQVNANLDGGAIARLVLDRLHESQPERSLVTGQRWLDDKLNVGGVTAGMLIFVTARPNLFKSTLTRWLFVESILRHNQAAKVLMCDAEARAVDTIFQFAARRCQTSIGAFHRGLRDVATAAIAAAQIAIQEVGELAAGRLFIDDHGPFTPEHIDSLIARIGPDLVLIDDWQSILVETGGNSDANARDLARAEWVQARRRGGPAFVAVHHERKATAGGADRLEVMMGHSISAYRADLVLSVVQDGDTNSMGLTKVEVRCIKNRHGARGWSGKMIVNGSTAEITVAEE